MPEKVCAAEHEGVGFSIIGLDLGIIGFLMETISDDNSKHTAHGLTLVMIRGKYPLVMIGGGGLNVPPPLFLSVKTIEKVIKLCTVLKKKIEWEF